MANDGDKAALNVHAKCTKQCLIGKTSAGYSEILALDLYTASLDKPAFDVPKAEKATATEIRMCDTELPRYRIWCCTLRSATAHSRWLRIDMPFSAFGSRLQAV
ncbi:hypothetical protein KC315_g10 [Hortaea werneckii]|nr:hypothetical protein KC315_g10 [Hortaea werneckii]